MKEVLKDAKNKNNQIYNMIKEVRVNLIMKH